tara:strand:+ start:105 stop:356 length:252 start_codon:yes stop_codon:yes gene_type:complete
VSQRDAAGRRHKKRVHALACTQLDGDDQIFNAWAMKNKRRLATFFVLWLAGVHLNDRFDGAWFRRLTDFAFSHFEEIPRRAFY